MGILDDAIREHLELKRKHGVPAEEVERQEAEALGPVRREVAPTQAQDTGEADAAATAEPTADGEIAADASTPASQSVVDPAPPAAIALSQMEAEPLEATQSEPPVADAEEALPQPELHAESEAAVEPAPITEPEPVAEPESVAEPDLEPEPVAERELEPAFEPEPELEPEPVVEPDAVLEPEPARSGDTPPRGFDALDGDGEAYDEREDEPPDQDADVLEDTPDFLQETPEHDRLWFEQKPPRDFDFD